MKKQYAALWVVVLLLSLSLVAILVILPRQQQAVSATMTPLPTNTARALALAPTRFLPTVAAHPTATDLPTPYPSLTPFVLTLAAPAPRVFQASNEYVPNEFMLANYCASFGSPVSLRLFDWDSGITISLSDEAIARIPLGWNASSSIWQGYNSLRPFNQPDDAVERWKINLYLSDTTERWIEIAFSPQSPDVYYVYSFQNIVPFAQPNGDHFGYHPCRAFTITTAQMQSFLTTVEQFQDSVRYPALIDGSDTRWARGTARPVAAYADLRAIPSTAYNDPIGAIDQPVTVWYALDETWGSWAQVKVGSVQGWVDTASVTFVPAT